MTHWTDEKQKIDTRLLDAAQNGVIEEAARLLANGFLVVFPTDTVYGVGAAVQNSEAVMNIYRAKGRPIRKGIPVLIADRRNLADIVGTIPEAVKPLIERYWPGPLTLVLARRPELPAVLSPNEGVAVRLPDGDIARQLISAAGGALAVSSANLSSEPPSRSAQEAYRALGGRAALIIDGGQSPGGTASTVLNCLEMPPRIERPGPITVSQIEQYLALGS